MGMTTAAALFNALRDKPFDAEGMSDFYDWVHAEVLPAIFANGGYVLNPSRIEDAAVANLYAMPLPAVFDTVMDELTGESPIDLPD